MGDATPSSSGTDVSAEKLRFTSGRMEPLLPVPGELEDAVLLRDLPLVYDPKQPLRTAPALPHPGLCDAPESYPPRRSRQESGFRRHRLIL